MGSIVHHLVGDQSIYQPLNASDFIKKAIPIIQDCHKRQKTVYLVGGSGFYLQALLKGMYDSPTTSKEILSKSDKLYLKEGILPFIKELELVDQESAARYHQNDHYRVRRALEHFWQTGTKFSDSRQEMVEKNAESPVEKYNWNILHIHLDLPKDEHFEIIQTRTKNMVQAGLVNEVQALLDSGANGSEKPLLSIGYKETIGFIHGDFPDQSSYEERLSINTRRLAKSQRTWFKKVEKKSYHPLHEQSIILEDCTKFLEK